MSFELFTLFFWNRFFLLVHPFASYCSLPIWKLHQILCLVLMQRLNLHHHSTHPSTFLLAVYSLLKSSRIPATSNQCIRNKSSKPYLISGLIARLGLSMAILWCCWSSKLDFPAFRAWSSISWVSNSTCISCSLLLQLSGSCFSYFLVHCNMGFSSKTISLLMTTLFAFDPITWSLSPISNAL